MKKVMPFIAHMKEEVENHGIESLNLSSSFNEKNVLESNLNFIKK